jgi:hypothetical protein
LRGKAASDQFVTMAELFGSDRAALAAEVSVNAKAVFLNLLFWAGSDCAAIGEELHREVVAAVMQAWKSSHSAIPLLGRKSL